jgi:hypothetical protein
MQQSRCSSVHELAGTCQWLMLRLSSKPLLLWHAALLRQNQQCGMGDAPCMAFAATATSDVRCRCHIPDLRQYPDRLLMMMLLLLLLLLLLQVIWRSMWR